MTSLPASERAGTRQRGYHRKTRENDHRETRSGEGEATEATGEGSPSRTAQGRESHSPYSNRRGRSRPCRADMGATSSALLVPQQPSFSSYCLRSHDHRGRDSSDNKTTRAPPVHPAERSAPDAHGAENPLSFLDVFRSTRRTGGRNPSARAEHDRPGTSRNPP